MWDLPGPGIEPVSPALAGRFLTTVPPGKSWTTVLKSGRTGFENLIPPLPRFMNTSYKLTLQFLLLKNAVSIYTLLGLF